MIACRIVETVPFMKQLFYGSLLDNFFFVEGTVRTFVTFSVNGVREKSYVDLDEEKATHYVRWGEMKSYFRSFTLDEKMPLFFSITLSPEFTAGRETGHIHPDDICFLHLKYEKKQLYLITGYSEATFSMQKSGQREWDRLVKLFCRKHQILLEED